MTNMMRHPIVIILAAWLAGRSAACSPGQPPTDKEKLLNAIRQEADRILAGDPADPKGIRQHVGEKPMLVGAWNVAGSWAGIACDPATGDSYALEWSGTTVVQFDSTGKELRRAALELAAEDRPVGSLWLANLAGDNRPEILLRYGTGHTVGAFDISGKRLWTYVTDNVVTRCWSAHSLRNPENGYEPVVVGCDRGGGVHLVDSDGKPRWVETSDSVRSVCADPAVTNCGAPIAVLDGKIRFLDAKGKPVRVIDAVGYSMISVSAPGAAAGATVIASARDHIAGLDCSGKVLWKSPVPSGISDGLLVDGAASPDGPWFAAAYYDGTVVARDPATGQSKQVVQHGIVALYDTTTGTLLASVVFDARQIAWTRDPTDKSPLLLVAGNRIRAFRVGGERPVASPEPAVKQPSGSGDAGHRP